MGLNSYECSALHVSRLAQLPGTTGLKSTQPGLDTADSHATCAEQRMCGDRQES